MTTEAIILAGGRGTRLGSITEATPKPLIPVAGRPFLFHVLDYLVSQGITHVVLAIGYLADEFKVIPPNYRGIRVTHAAEPCALGTGGGIAYAMNHINSAECFVFNGDTYFPADLADVAGTHERQNADLSMVLRAVPDITRYGSVLIDGEKVTALREKLFSGPGLINGGIYLLNRRIFSENELPEEFSLEQLLLPKLVSRGTVAGVESAAYFIDIGIPADLETAQTSLATKAS